MRIDPEPAPRLDQTQARREARPESWTALPRAIRSPAPAFLDVLHRRRSAVGGDLGIDDLSSLLWHATLLRTREPDGRFGLPWESRPAPSAGGLHPMRLLVLSVGEGISGQYVPDHHGLAPVSEEAVAANRSSVREILGATAGATVQFACDAELLDGCYENAVTLMWRDAGALATILCLTATALGLTSVILGRTGEAIVSAAGLPQAFRGAGAVLIGKPRSEVVS